MIRNFITILIVVFSRKICTVNYNKYVLLHMHLYVISEFEQKKRYQLYIKKRCDKEGKRMGWKERDKESEINTQGEI